MAALLGAMLLAASSAVAQGILQDGTGARVSPTRPEASRVPGTAPFAPLADSVEDPATLLRLAESALAARRTREAADLLERAESRLLTRSELATEADRPAVGGAVGEIAAARDAIGRRDAAGAATLMASALRRLQAGEAPAVVALPAPPLATGGTSSPAPAWGGGAAPAFPGTPPLSAAGAVPLPAGVGVGAPLQGIVPQNMPVGGTASPAIPIGPDQEFNKTEPLPGSIPPASSKPPPM
jgi:hypothetical protein